MYQERGSVRYTHSLCCWWTKFPFLLTYDWQIVLDHRIDVHQWPILRPSASNSGAYHWRILYAFFLWKLLQKPLPLHTPRWTDPSWWSAQFSLRIPCYASGTFWHQEPSRVSGFFGSGNSVRRLAGILWTWLDSDNLPWHILQDHQGSCKVDLLQTLSAVWLRNMHLEKLHQ